MVRWRIRIIKTALCLRAALTPQHYGLALIWILRNRTCPV